MNSDSAVLDDYVTIAVFARASGLSENAIRLKIRDGKWLEGREFIRAPDGHVMIHRAGVHNWYKRGKK